MQSNSDILWSIKFIRSTVHTPCIYSRWSAGLEASSTTVSHVNSSCLLSKTAASLLLQQCVYILLSGADSSSLLGCFLRCSLKLVRSFHKRQDDVWKLNCSYLRSRSVWQLGAGAVAFPCVLCMSGIRKFWFLWRTNPARKELMLLCFSLFTDYNMLHFNSKN